MNFFSKMVILLSSFLFVLSSCGEQSSVSQGSLDPNGSTISETVIGQQLMVEDILSEDKLGELEINTEKVVQEKVSEKIIVQDLKIEMMPAEDALDHYYYGDLTEDDGGASSYDINWPMVIGKFAAGSVVIIATGVAAYFTSEIPGVGYVFLCSFKESLKEAVIGAAIASALSSAFAALTTGGNVDVVKKYAIESAADGFMWGAISGALLGAFSGYVNYYKDTSCVFQGNKLLGRINNKGEIINGGKIVGYKTQNGFVLDSTYNVIGTTDAAGNISSSFSSLIPESGKILDSTGDKVLYTIDKANRVFDSLGNKIGTINDAGQIIDSSGCIVTEINESGRAIHGLSNAIGAGLKINPSGAILNTSRTVGGVTTYFDNAGKTVAFISKTTNSAGKSINYLRIPVDPNSIKYMGTLPAGGLNRTVAQIDDAGQFVFGWKSTFGSERAYAISKAWAQEKALVEATGQGTRNWSKAEIAELLATGKVAGYAGHHINSAIFSPELAANPNNIMFYTKIEHLLIGHGGNWLTVTFGELLSRLFKI